MVGVASLAVGYFMMRQNDNEVKNGKQRFIFGECLVNSVLFVLAIAVNFGMSIWITFVAGRQLQ